MDLLEYQAKELFQQVDIPVLPSQRIGQPKELKDLQIPYPVVLKSQVYSGGRGKAGGVRFAENTIDAVAAAQAIFHLPIMGQYPAVLLAEAKYESDRELYLAVVLDRSSRRPLLLGSYQGGIEVAAIVGQMQRVWVDQEFSPFYARRLAIQMGLRGNLIHAVSNVLEKMYWLFVEKDLDLVEINPLAVNPQGEVMALDGRIIANDVAVARHSDLVALTEQAPHAESLIPLPDGMKLIELDGTLGVLCNGGALSMTTLDLVYRAGGKAAHCLNIGGECSHDLPPATLPERVQRGLDWLSHHRSTRTILLNLMSGVTDCEPVARAIANYLRHRIGSARPNLVVRLVGDNLAIAQEILQNLDVPVFSDLDEAISKSVLLSQSKVA